MNILSTNDYDNIIKENVSKLSHEWFLGKEKAFKSHKNYDSTVKKIIITFKDRIYTGSYDSEGVETSNQYEDNSTALEIDLAKYCSSYLPINELTEWGNFNMIDLTIGSQKLSNNIPEFAATLVSEISVFCECINDIAVITKFISASIERISLQCDVLKSNFPKDDEYVNALKYFLKVCYSYLNNKFKSQLILSELTIDYKDKLDFDLTQEEMASLLYILAKAGILKHTEYEHPQFLPFCLKYFTVHKKGENNVVNNTEGFIDKYRKIFDDKNGSGLSKIKSKLEPILKNIVVKSKQK